MSLRDSMPLSVEAAEAWLRQNPQPHPGGRCRFADPRLSSIVAELKQRKWSGSAIGAYLRASGIEVGDNAVNRHLRGACRCD